MSLWKHTFEDVVLVLQFPLVHVADAEQALLSLLVTVTSSPFLVTVKDWPPKVNDAVLDAAVERVTGIDALVSPLHCPLRPEAMLTDVPDCVTVAVPLRQQH